MELAEIGDRLAAGPVFGWGELRAAATFGGELRLLAGMNEVGVI